MPLHTVLNLSSSLCWGLWAPRELNLRKEKKQRGQDPSSRPHNPPNIYGHAGGFMLVTGNLSQQTCHSCWKGEGNTHKQGSHALLRTDCVLSTAALVSQWTCPPHTHPLRELRLSAQFTDEETKVFAYIFFFTAF